MRSRWKLGAVVGAAALAWLAAPLGAEEAEPVREGEERAVAEDPAEAPAQPAERRAQARAAGGVWWNQPAVAEALSLTEEQRKQMDGHLEAYQKASQNERRETLTAFHEALGQGDWEKARSEIEQFSTQVAEPVRARGELKIEVLAALSDEQRKTLAEKYPQLISQPWPRATARGARRGGGKAR